MIMKYSVLTYNINNYEILKEIKYKSPNAEYIYITDNKNLKSDTWTIKYVDNPHPEDPFYLCYDIRFNPFKYVNADIVLRYDASMDLIGNTDELIEEFERGEYDAMLCIHPERNTMRREYDVWVNVRHYNPLQEEKILNYMLQQGYDIDGYRGLYQGNIIIQRNNEINNNINKDTLELLFKLKEDGKQIERINQTIFSFIVNTRYKNLKVMPVSNNIAFSKYFLWYNHHSNNPIIKPHNIDCYLFNEKITPFL